MAVSITLSDNTDYVDTVIVDSVDNKRCFSYTDNEKNKCNLTVYDTGICLIKECEDHLLELHLHNDSYAKITTQEGVVKLDAKVVDFLINDDILVMRYIIDDVERKIEINYRG